MQTHTHSSTCNTSGFKPQTEQLVVTSHTTTEEEEAVSDEDAVNLFISHLFSR